MSCWTAARNTAEKFAAPIAETATTILAPELAPVLDPLEGAVIGGIQGGGKGALIGGLEGAVGGQIGGTGDLAIGSTPGTGFLGSVGSESLGGQALDAIGGAFSSASDALGLTSPSAGGAAIDSTTGLPFGQEATNNSGATINSATGATVAAPSTPTTAAPVSGGGFTPASQAIDAGTGQIATQTGGTDIASTSGSPGLGNISGSTSVPSSSVGQLFNGTSVRGQIDSSIGSQSAGPIGDIQGGTINLSPASGAAASPSSSGGISGFIPSKSDVGKMALQSALPVGALAYEAIKGPPTLPTATQPLTASGSVTAPLLATETSQANAFNSGTLTAPQQASIDQWVQDQQNALIQQLANEGVTNMSSDSRYIAGVANIQKQAIAQKQQMLQQDIQNAFQAAGGAAGALGQVANAQVANDTAYQNALAEAMAALGGVGSVTRAAA